jgi:hypothetical protein
MQMKPQLKSLMPGYRKTQNFRMTWWRLVTSVDPRHACGWGAESP